MEADKINEAMLDNLYDELESCAYIPEYHTYHFK